MKGEFELLNDDRASFFSGAPPAAWARGGANSPGSGSACASGTGSSGASGSAARMQACSSSSAHAYNGAGPRSAQGQSRPRGRPAAAGDGGENGEFSPDTQIILSKARDLLVNSNGAAIKRKSFKFLLKKMFACRGGFGPAPSLKDPVESRMEKVKKKLC